MTEWVERDYILEKKAAVKEFEEKKIDLKENLLTDMEEKRKIIESDRHTMELTGDSMEVLEISKRYAEIIYIYIFQHYYFVC